MERFCKICFEKIRFNFLRSLIESKINICSSCLEKIKVDISSLVINNTKIKFLSRYDSLLKQILIKYKESLDYELRDTLLYLFLPYIRLYSLNYIFVPIPSSKTSLERRGFSHLNEILNISKLKYADILENNEVDIQKNLNISSRVKNKNITLKSNACNYKNKNIILFDDVYTSGTTFLSALNEIKKISPRRVKGLILMRNTYTFS